MLLFGSWSKIWVRNGRFWAKKGPSIFQKMIRVRNWSYGFLKLDHRGYLKLQYEKNWQPITKPPWYTFSKYWSWLLNIYHSQFRSNLQRLEGLNTRNLGKIKYLSSDHQNPSILSELPQGFFSIPRFLTLNENTLSTSELFIRKNKNCPVECSLTSEADE